MRNKILLIAILPLCMLLTGCPYNSKVPLSETSKEPIDRTLLGEWKSSKDPADSARLSIYEFNKNEYAITIVDHDAKGVSIDYYRAYLTPVAGKMLLNMENLKSKGEFNFFSYSIEGSSLNVRIVSDVEMKKKYDTPKALKKAFAESIHNKGFFEVGPVFTRVP